VKLDSLLNAESVEALLREIGIDYTQGYLRHRPQPLDQAFGWDKAIGKDRVL
jgi:hypothetical protein